MQSLELDALNEVRKSVVRTEENQKNILISPKQLSPSSVPPERPEIPCLRGSSPRPLRAVRFPIFGRLICR
ncbi:hypothetical protein M413DRAFT_134429 [Hebeloma cylindrosporum]|uniref:Uncharacterized protein n=1 Tax=Hebeloma cylindrosporum TaxID=76867 RepID=A0A0C2YN57_HEBCY|nr:hypothetical protein M413DRAFT_134429 [Hebeloma cylindrosporum h7]